MPPAPITITSASATQLFTAAQAEASSIGQTAASAYFGSLIFLDIFGFLVAAALFAGVVYIIIKTGYVRVRIERIRHIVLKTDLSKKKAQASWENVQRHFFEGDENDLKVAIMDADKLLNEALKRAGVLGAQLGDRLKNATTEQIPNLDDIWQAHKLRNQIAHEPNFRLKRDAAQRALAIYEEALRNLGIFDGGSKQ